MSCMSGVGGAMTADWQSVYSGVIRNRVSECGHRWKQSEVRKVVVSDKTCPALGLMLF